MAKPEWMPQRLYQWVKVRSLILHLVYLSCSAGCITAMWWQVQRAMQGNVLSYLYSVEWPTFVVVGGIGWWQLVHDTPESIAERRAFHSRMRAASAEVVARTLPRSATALTVDSRDIPANRLGAKSGPPMALGAGADPARGALVEVGRPDSFEEATLIRSSERAYAARGLEETSSFEEAGGFEEVGDEMTEYNRYLALLAVKGKSKTWRNPHGV
jgi:hypothetical protein